MPLKYSVLSHWKDGVAGDAERTAGGADLGERMEFGFE